MSITVAREGNRREGGVTRAEIDQACLDLQQFFGHAPNPGLDFTQGEVEKLSKIFGTPLPGALLALMEGRCCWFMEKRLLSAAEVLSHVERLERCKGWCPAHIPFAADLDGNLLVTDSGDGWAVYEWEDGAGCSNGALAPSFNSFVEEQRNQLLSGRYEYIEDVGVVEK
ncbi:unnamed protein product, partial [Phaeothamnion confervicola]